MSLSWIFELQDLKDPLNKQMIICDEIDGRSANESNGIRKIPISITIHSGNSAAIFLKVQTFIGIWRSFEC